MTEHHIEWFLERKIIALFITLPSVGQEAPIIGDQIDGLYLIDQKKPSSMMNRSKYWIP